MPSRADPIAVRFCCKNSVFVADGCGGTVPVAETTGLGKYVSVAMSVHVVVVLPEKVSVYDSIHVTVSDNSVNSLVVVEAPKLMYVRVIVP